MRYYEAQSTVATAPQQVWNVLADGAAWPTWDSGVDAVDGRLGSGKRVTIRSAAAPGRAFPVRVSEWETASRIVLTGGMPLGLFRGVRSFSLTPGPGGTVFRVREEYTGPLLPVIWRSMPDLAPSFQQFA